MRITSVMPRKQRKAQANAPLHMRHRMVACHLDSPLIKEYNVRSLPVKKGDTVKILRGGEGVKGVEAKVASVDLKHRKLTLDGITIAKADGTQKAKPIEPSNCIITKLDLSDPLRKGKLAKLKGGSK
ncbi:MAG: 50S ribosomal protein L24 [Thermoplasmata archaeon]|nr:50S ribosomal protein L24 [Thermoplasmata archaeon]